MLLPGLDGTGRLFAPFTRRLRCDEVHVVDYPRDQVLNNDALVSLICDRVEPGARHVVVAESFSGPVAVKYALQRSDDVAALVLCASFLQNPLPPAFRSLPRLASSTLFKLPLPGLLARLLLLDFQAPASLVRKVQAAVAEVDPVVLSARVRSLAEVDVSEQCSRLEMPVLYLQATDDQLVGDRGAMQVTRALPQAEVRQLDAPHLVLQTRPREAAMAITELLDAIQQVSTE